MSMEYKWNINYHLNETEIIHPCVKVQNLFKWNLAPHLDWRVLLNYCRMIVSLRTEAIRK